MQRRVPEVVPHGMEIARGDLGDPEAVDRAVRGARVVIHAGAAMKGGWTEHECATVIGTRNVLEACCKHGVEKLVHISSLSVVGNSLLLYGNNGRPTMPNSLQTRSG